MTRKEAIKGSLNKWNAICNDLMDMKKAIRRCALCNKYASDCLGTCPLYEMGRGCGVGPWQDISDILWKTKGDFLTSAQEIKNRDIGTLSEQECWLPLSVYCAEMRETLQKLYDAEVKKAKDEE